MNALNEDVAACYHSRSPYSYFETLFIFEAERADQNQMLVNGPISAATERVSSRIEKRRRRRCRRRRRRRGRDRRHDEVDDFKIGNSAH